ncbi:MAG: B-box zinc finger protein [Desulfatiglandales bacterium]
MQCKYHRKRKAEFFCVSCNSPLCKECTEQVRPGHYLCFQCAMQRSVSEVGTSMRERREKEDDRTLKKKKKWGPFQYFVIVSSVLILVMWGVIVFGGQKRPPRTAAVDFTKRERVLLFMVDGAIKRYAHYERDKYPEQLTDLIPKYLSLRENEVSHLRKLSYQRDLRVGYRLSLASPQSGQMNIILTPQGLEYTSPSRQGA